MPRLLKKHLTPLQYPELRLIAMLGMGMDVNLAYSGDTDNVFKWMCDNQDKFNGVDIGKLATPNKPGRPGPLRMETVVYVRKMQKYLAGEEHSVPNWAGIACETENEISEQKLGKDKEQEPMTNSILVSENNFPQEWLTKAGTPDKRKAVVRAVLSGDLTLDEAIEKESNSLKYIPKTTGTDETVKNKSAETSEYIETLTEEPTKKPSYIATPSIKTTSVALDGDETAKKVHFKKKSLKTKATKVVTSDNSSVLSGLEEKLAKIGDRMDYVSSTLSDIKQKGFERQQSLTENVLELQNAVLFIINSVVLEDNSVDTLADIPTPDEY